MTDRRRYLLPALIAALLGTSGSAPVTGQTPGADVAFAINATAHPPVAADAVWIAPSGKTVTGTALARGAAELRDGRAEKALPLVTQPAPTPALAPYQQYFRALALTRLERLDEAAREWKALIAARPAGYLSELAQIRLAELHETAGRHGDAVRIYEALTKTKTVAPDDALLRLARALEAAGDRQRAIQTYARVYYEHPLSDVSAVAAAQIDKLGAWEPLATTPSRVQLELGRAERLFAARRYAQARDAYAELLPHVRGDERELVSLRVAESDHYLRRYRAAVTALEPWTKNARRRAEAQFFHLTATRALGQHAEYVRLAKALVAEFPTESWAEETLNNLGTHFIVTDQDDEADRVFRQMLRMFPEGKHAPRAAWKVGWNAYRTAKYQECAEVFENAAATFPRSDYRPAWLYWAARSRDRLGDTRIAQRLYGVVIADYLNSYYGRLASNVLTSRQLEPLTLAAAVGGGGAQVVTAAAETSADPVPTADLIRALIRYELYDQALDEVRWAERIYGESPVLTATQGLIYSRKGELRRAINAVKRAYPQYMAAGGEQLPVELLQVLFPVAYWELIEKYAKAHNLDPYLIAALMAQESTFAADIRSSANAIGLMQIVPSTGRRYARKLGIPFSTHRLTNPEVNVRIGTKYFREMVDRFGGVHLALASYNAGPSAVARWVAERPGIAQDEFIDDIPYPETQNYVKKILGTAEDYRRLYNGGGARPILGAPGTRAVAPAPTVKRTSAPAKKKAPAKRRTSSRRRAQ